MHPNGKRNLQLADFLRRLAAVLIRKSPDAFRSDGVLNIEALVREMAAKSTARLSTWSEAQHEVARNFDALPTDRRRYLAADALAELQRPEGTVRMNAIT